MFVYVLFFIAIASVYFVESATGEKLEENRNMKDAVYAIKSVNTELQTYMEAQKGTGHEVKDRRILTCSCGTYKPEAGDGDAAPTGCCFCITDGCGSSASVCCDRHTYCNCVTGDCGICIDLGTNTQKGKLTDRYSKSIDTFKAIYDGSR